MNSRSNQILIGVIAILLGIFVFLQRYLRIDYSAITVAAAGFAFLLLYRTKGKSWSLCLGVYMLGFGMIGIFRGLLTGYVFEHLISILFFLSPGVIFMVLYYSKGKRGLLVPGCLLIWFAFFLLSTMIPFLHSGAMFFFCLGLAFLTIYVIGKDFIGKFPLYFGFAMEIMALLTLCAMSPVFALIHKAPIYAPIILICIGLFVILRAINKKP